MELLFASAKPYWEEEPKDVETSVGASTTFICKAKGYPEPKIAWFVNGIKLEGTEFCSRICWNFTINLWLLRYITRKKW